MTSKGSVILKCERCSKEYHRTPSNMDGSRFCSRACQRSKNNREAECKTCGETFVFATSQLKHYPNAGSFCSKKCMYQKPGLCVVCNETSPGAKYCPKHRGKKYLTLGPIERRAWSMSANLRVEDKRALTVGLITDALGKPCPYCSIELTLANIGLDHKEPFGHKTMKAQERWASGADRPDNLHIICRKCNSRKGDFTDKEYRTLLSLPDGLAAKLMVRLSAATTFWRAQKSFPKR